MARLLFAVFLAFATLVPRAALAHGMRSAYLEVTELDHRRALLRLSVASGATGLSVPVPPGCREEDEAAAAALQRIITCDGGLEGRAVEVRGIGPLVSEVVLQVTFVDGNSSARILTAEEPTFIIPRASSHAALLLDYARLGVKHIFGGVDHLLFLAALALSVRRMRAILLAETAFTASHSLSFTASALGWIHVSSVAAEACIALSLVLVALDAAEASATGVLVPPRRAAPLAFVFGLVHGLGFAAGLSEIGMPDRSIGWALLGFAGGVEVGQVLFLVALVASLFLVSRTDALRRAPLALAYVVGGTGAFLFLVRAAALLDTRWGIG